MTDTPPEIVERMEKMIRRLAAEYTWNEDGKPYDVGAKRIIADLDRHREPDLELAQRIAAENLKDPVKAALAGIKRGRELATGSGE